MQFVPEHNVYVYFRYTDSETVMVVINNNKETQELDLKRFSEIIKKSKSGHEILSNKTILFENNLNVEGKSAMIIELQ